jgi:hypothetical protein
MSEENKKDNLNQEQQNPLYDQELQEDPDLVVPLGDEEEDIIYLEDGEMQALEQAADEEEEDDF